MTIYKFSAASINESIVFGAARPGYHSDQVTEWLEFMQSQHIQRVCCLLPESQLTRYDHLLDIYRQTFSMPKVCWAPIADFCLVDRKTLFQQILPFLTAADQNNEKVVVHCSGGIGRTGHILAAWLVAGRGFAPVEAIAAVKRTGRNPHEAAITAPLKGRNPWKIAADLKSLLDECDRWHSNLN
jgi:protein-tyrosine phosphatase